MQTVKRWAFLPFLALLCAWLGYALTGNNHTVGWIVAVVLFVPWAIVWDRRRMRI